MVKRKVLLSKRTVVSYVPENVAAIFSLAHGEDRTGLGLDYKRSEVYIAEDSNGVPVIVWEVWSDGPETNNCKITDPKKLTPFYGKKLWTRFAELAGNTLVCGVKKSPELLAKMATHEFISVA